MSLIERSPDGKCKVKRNASLIASFPEVPSSGSIKQALLDIERNVREEVARIGATVDSNAFNNTRGEWFEMLLNAHFLNYSVTSKRYFIFSIPSVSSAPLQTFFDADVNTRLDELNRHLQKNDIELKMSNPDFLCIDTHKLSEELRNQLPTQPMNEYTETSIAVLENLHRLFLGKLTIDSLIFALSVKTSIRPDRRYQFVHEGNVLKALFAHLQTRYWKTEFDVKYYAITNTITGNSDSEVLRTAALSSITNVFAKPVRAVDGMFTVDNFEEIEPLLGRLVT